MKSPAFALVALLVAAPHLPAADEGNAKARQLATEVWKASGGENWNKVKELHFTFIVEQDGQQIAAAEHRWDLGAGTDHVKWKDKEATVNLASPAQDELGKSAYARWVNDAYWLLAPLKVLDPGVTLTYEGVKESEGAQCETLRLTFAGVGLTPGDQYLLYIDSQTKLVRAWDYLPKADNVMHGTWENYQDFGGLKLATEHNFAGKMIRFADVTAKMAD
ncbi:MAG: hypothetical protein H0U88_07500 [Chthoniobacterales bacterium]|nr:hypothetical protein [Chthoniobacterales bacterium]